MKIATIIDLWEPIIGGSQTHVSEISRRLVNDHDFEVDIFTRAIIYESRIYDEDEALFNGRLRIIRVGPATEPVNTRGRIATLWTLAWRVFLESRKKNYDLIHAHSILGGVMGKLAAYLTKKPLLFTVHGSMNTDRGLKSFDYYIERWILTRIRYNKVISVAKGFLNYKNINKNIDVIPNGVSIDKFDRVQSVGKANFFKILFVGRLHWQKGVDTLIEAIKELKDRKVISMNGKKVQVHLIGYGFDILKYKETVDHLELNDCIIFRGKIVEEKLIREYKSSHLFLLPSLCEGQPITFLEAMASKLPILTTYSADNANILSEEVAWKVPENNSKELANKLAEIINLNEDILEKKGNNGYQRVKNDYTIDKIVSQTVNVYRSMRPDS